MKIIINESQLRLIVENEEEKEKLFSIHSSMVEGEGDVNSLMELYNNFKDIKGYDGIRLIGDFVLSYYYGSVYELCEELVMVSGNLEIFNRKGIKLPKLRLVSKNLELSFTNFITLPELEIVGENLELYKTKIESLPKLNKVGGYLNLQESPLSNMITEKELRQQINVKGSILL